MNERDKRDELIRELNDSLNDSATSKEDPFRKTFSVPENYFDKFSSALAGKISATGTSNIFNFIFSKQALVSLTVIILICGSLWFYKFSSSAHYTEPQLSEEDFNNASFSESLDENLIVDFISEQIPADSSQDSIEQYLLENHIQTSEIENAL